MPPARRSGRGIHVPLPAELALAWHALSRLAYAGGVGWALRQQDRRQLFTRAGGVEAGFRRFRRMASTVMNLDAVSFVVLSLVTRGSLGDRIAPTVLIPVGLALVAAGIGIKYWAARSLGGRAYYWYDFFAPESAALPDPPGPYRYLDNPMYTLGYLHAYGFALMCGSAWGLAAAVFDQVAILAFQHFVERPHVERLFAGRAPPRYL